VTVLVIVLIVAAIALVMYDARRGGTSIDYSWSRLPPGQEDQVRQTTHPRLFASL
jgi:hypothetical protein